MQIDFMERFRRLPYRQAREESQYVPPEKSYNHIADILMWLASLGANLWISRPRDGQIGGSMSTAEVEPLLGLKRGRFSPPLHQNKNLCIVYSGYGDSISITSH